MENNIKNLKPSEEKRWLKYYEEGAYQKANEVPIGKTVWDVIENKLSEFYDIPALEYFKKEISRQEFKDSVYLWARTFRAMGVDTDEIVPIYGPFFPDICAMTCALNMIGATPYFLKLSISEKALREETADAKIAVVYDGMWNNVKDVFKDDKFKKIIIATAADSMLHPKKEIVSFMNYIDAKKNNSVIPKNDKYIWVDEAKKVSNYYTGNVKVDFKDNRSAFITSSSGTTINGIVKGTIATNETAIAQLYQASNAGINYNPGKKCLTNLPPTASTSLNCLFFLPIYRGMTVINEPRLSEAGFYKQMVEYKPAVALTTGSLWESYFRSLEKDLKKGIYHDLSGADMWIIGGEGTNPEYYEKWCELMKKCGAEYPLFSGYGASEVFSVATVDNKNSLKEEQRGNRSVIGVGVPYPGVDVGVFDKNGNELGYNQRGELWIKSNAVMKGYYNKPELTSKTIVDGWVKTGDIFDINDNGVLFLWGRAKDKITLPNGEYLYMFDVANEIRKNGAVADVIVNAMPSGENDYSLVAHIVFNEQIDEENKNSYLTEIDEELVKSMPNIKIAGYKEHPITIKSSPTTAKKDRNALMKELTGYKKIVDNQEYSLDFEKTGSENYSLCYTLKEKSKSI